MKKNLFIAFEGLDGSGKTTQVKILSDKLKKAGHKVYFTFEPSDSPIGSLIKNIFKHRIEADHKTIAALFVADRLDHLLNKTNGILKKLEEGYTVITDRYYFSSYAYHGTHMDMNWVIESNSMSAEILRPDINIFIDVPPKICIQRLSDDRNVIELYETLDNLNNVREKYLESFAKLKDEESIFITNGDRSFNIIADDIWKAIEQVMKLQNAYT